MWGFDTYIVTHTLPPPPSPHRLPSSLLLFAAASCSLLLFALVFGSVACARKYLSMPSVNVDEIEGKPAAAVLVSMMNTQQSRGHGIVEECPPLPSPDQREAIARGIPPLKLSGQEHELSLRNGDGTPTAAAARAALYQAEAKAQAARSKLTRVKLQATGEGSDKQLEHNSAALSLL